MQTTAPKMHKFEAAGLGAFPYRYVGMETSEDREQTNREREANGQMFTTNHCTSCDYCATAITNAFWFESADGKRFKVGSDCVEKVGDKGMAAAIKQDRKTHEYWLRRNRETRKLIEGAAFVNENAERLAAIPHPSARRAAEGETLLDCIRWYEANAGTSGKLHMYRTARKALQ